MRPLLLGFATVALIQPCAAYAKAKSSHRSQPAHIKQSSPDVTGSIAHAESTPAVVPPAEPAPVHDVLVPYYLPAVSRARMRECGEQWQNKRMAGETGDDDWRDFASKCLASSTRD